MMTAMEISGLLGHDGQVFNTASGNSIQDLCWAALGKREVDTSRDAEKFTFQDGSVITICGGGWDYGYTDCFCWKGEGHSNYCEVTNITDESSDNTNSTPANPGLS